jgi:hypothetical protein
MIVGASFVACFSRAKRGVNRTQVVAYQDHIGTTD